MTLVHILLTADNNGLLAGEIFGLLFMVGFGLATIGTLIGLFKKSNTTGQKIKLGFVAIGGFILTGVGYRIINVENNLRKNSVYVEGITLDYCRTGKYGRHQGIEFEYFVDGIRFTNCNRGPKGVKVPGEKFWVRVSKANPDIGRIDFNRPIKN